MTQTLYAHMNKIKNKIKYLSQKALAKWFKVKGLSSSHSIAKKKKIMLSKNIEASLVRI
jgi:hypothetical protein